MIQNVYIHMCATAIMHDR